MPATQDNLLIIEKLLDNVQIQKLTDNSYIFEGTFTIFDVKNDNDRYYKKENVLPLIEALQPRIQRKKLLGELDHPAGFDVKLDNASHVIEMLMYDATKNCIRGRIRLLNTPKGKIAQALVEAGIPLNISSRASGQINKQGVVVLNAIYTYDLVHQPGFSEAELYAVAESRGDNIDEFKHVLESVNLKPKFELLTLHELSTENIQIYELKTKNLNDNSMADFISKSEFETWSQKMVGNMEELQLRIKTVESENNLLKGTILENKKDSGNNIFEERLSALEDKMTLLSGNIEKRLKVHENYLTYLRENLQTVADYSEGHLAESVQKVIDYVDNHIAENLQTLANYTQDHIGKNLQNLILYTEQHIKPSIETIGNYAQNELAQKIQVLADYTEGHIRESLQTLIDYVEGPIRENLEDVGSYAEIYLKECIETIAKKETILEKNKFTPINNKVKQVIEGIEDSRTNWQNAILERLDKITLAEKNKDVNENKTGKEAITDPDNTNSNQVPLVLKYIPEAAKAKFEKLSKNKQQQLINISENYTLTSQYQIEYWWNNVADLTERVEIKIDPTSITNESKANEFKKLYGFDVASFPAKKKKQ